MILNCLTCVYYIETRTHPGISEANFCLDSFDALRITILLKMILHGIKTIFNGELGIP